MIFTRESKLNLKDNQQGHLKKDKVKDMGQSSNIFLFFKEYLFILPSLQPTPPSGHVWPSDQLWIAVFSDDVYV